MPTGLPGQRWRTAVRRALLAVAVVAVIALAASTPCAGRYLDDEDPLGPADAIFVLAGARVERWLEAVDLYKQGYAPQILLSEGKAEAAEELLRARGIRFPSETDLARDAIIQLGVPGAAVEVLAQEVDNTAQEARALHARASARGWRRILIVTSKYHCRRARFAFGREFAGGATILLRGSRYDASDPAHWWRDRADVRFVLQEMQKLLLYRLGLGG